VKRFAAWEVSVLRSIFGDDLQVDRLQVSVWSADVVVDEMHIGTTYFRVVLAALMASDANC